MKELLNNNKKKAKKISKNSNGGVTVKGLSNVLIRFARCCNPLPGDGIIGYITRGKGVSVHRKDCKNIYSIPASEKDKLVEVVWTEAEKSGYTAEIQIIAEDRPGMLSEVTVVISELKIQIDAINARTTDDGLFVSNTKLRITDVAELNNVIKRLKRIKGIMEVARIEN